MAYNNGVPLGVQIENSFIAGLNPFERVSTITSLTRGYFVARPQTNLSTASTFAACLISRTYHNRASHGTKLVRAADFDGQFWLEASGLSDMVSVCSRRNTRGLWARGYSEVEPPRNVKIVSKATLESTKPLPHRDFRVLKGELFIELL